jgi:hypothetical protein
MPWSRRFDKPIFLPDGRQLLTLLDAGRYVNALPRRTYEREEWIAVMEVLLLVVDGQEPVSLLQVALTLAFREGDEGPGQEIEGDPMTVLIYVNTSKQVGDLPYSCHVAGLI